MKTDHDLKSRFTIRFSYSNQQNKREKKPIMSSSTGGFAHRARGGSFYSRAPAHGGHGVGVVQRAHGLAIGVVRGRLWCRAAEGHGWRRVVPWRGSAGGTAAACSGMAWAAHGHARATSSRRVRAPAGRGACSRGGRRGSRVRRRAS